MNTEPPKKPFFSRLVHNWVTLIGAILVVSSWFAFCLLLTLDFFAATKNPYLGILTFLVAPFFFLLGLIFMGAGWLVQRRQTRHAAAGAPPTRFTIDVSRPRDRKILLGFAVGGALFLLVTSVGSYQTYHVTESVQFCGQACHTPMNPQYVAYQNSPHARVECTACHIGPGAENFLRAKFNGLHQVYAVLVDNYHRPIHKTEKNPIHQQRCEQCHWPKRFIGNLDRTYTHFLADETNTQFSVRLLLKVGGADPTHGPVGGIHWHMNVANKIEYIASDDLRQVIPWVRLTDTNGVVTEFRTANFKDDPAVHTIRTMDCLDCHNRPAHHFRAPNDAVDLDMAAGRIDRSIPLVKSNVVAALTGSYSTEDEALQKIADRLRSKYANAPQLASLVAETQRIYRNNFFPEMKTDWRAYPNNLGHKEWPGCFRCHDGLHKAADGKTRIQASDCNSCHVILAQGSGEQLEKLNAKGYSFFHIDAINEDFSCNNCHTGAFPKE
jgi:nitrate/TMAO reductase-like tetraheme cytochrome c subunit